MGAALPVSLRPEAEAEPEPQQPEPEPGRNCRTVGWGGPKDPEKREHRTLPPGPALWLATASVSPLESLASALEDCWEGVEFSRLGSATADRLRDSHPLPGLPNSALGLLGRRAEIIV